MSDPTVDMPPRLCAWCGGPVPEQKGAGRRRDYCRRSCRQRAYEERRVQERIEEREKLARIAVLAEIAANTSRAEMAPAAPALNPARDEMARLSAPRKRRPLLPPPPGMARPDAPPLRDPQG